MQLYWVKRTSQVHAHVSLRSTGDKGSSRRESKAWISENHHLHIHIHIHLLCHPGPLQQQQRLAHRAALKLPGQLKVEKGEEEEEKRRSGNDLKKQAHQAVRWGMELASFSIPK